MNDNKTVVTVILDRRRKEALEKHFSGMGLNFSNGVRMILYNYLDNSEAAVTGAFEKDRSADSSRKNRD